MPRSKSRKSAAPRHPAVGAEPPKNKPPKDIESFLKGPIQEEQSLQGAAAEGSGAGANVPPTTPPEACCQGQTSIETHINCPTVHHPTCPVGQCCVGATHLSIHVPCPSAHPAGCPSVNVVCPTLHPALCPVVSAACQTLQAGCPTIINCPSVHVICWQHPTATHVRSCICPTLMACPTIHFCPTLQDCPSIHVVCQPPTQIGCVTHAECRLHPTVTRVVTQCPPRCVVTMPACPTETQHCPTQLPACHTEPPICHPSQTPRCFTILPFCPGQGHVTATRFPQCSF